MSFVEVLRGVYGELRELSGDLEGDDHAVGEIPGLDGVFLAVDRSTMALLLPIEPSHATVDQDLEHLTIRYGVEFELVSGKRSLRHPLVVVRTVSLEPWLTSTFLQLVGALLDVFVPDGEKTLAGFLDDLIELFRGFLRPTREGVMGCWGELFVISRSADVDLAVESWHSTPHDRFDFSRNHERIEVKTTTGPRVHQFSHEQLVEFPGRRVTIASVVLTSDSEGLSCADLVSRIKDRLRNPELIRSVLSQLVLSLGSEWTRQDSGRFNIDEAERSIRFIDVKAVPKLVCEVPPRVASVQYRSDLQDSDEVVLSEIEPDNRLLRAMIGQGDRA